MKLLLEAGEAARLPVMIHVGDTAEPLGKILEMLRPGDVVSHYLTSRKKQSPGDPGEPGRDDHPGGLRGTRSGGDPRQPHGGATTWPFRRCRPAVEHGLLPDTFSTDLAVHTAADPDFTLMAVATHFMSFGLSFEGPAWFE